jgi:DNA-directed RNA polymerase subunit RPC12/RpoP
MLNYFQNKKSGELVAVNSETNEIVEFKSLSANSETASRGGADIEKPKREYNSKVQKLQDFVVGKEKTGKNCASCGKAKEKGKYFSKGLCMTCYSREVYRKKQGIEVEQKKDDSPKKYECIDCGEIIKSTLEFDKVMCPKNSHHKMVQR